MELSLGYFIADFVHFILFEPDVLMFVHHVFSILTMGTAGVIGRAGACGTAAIFQGEITNPFQSAWTMARFAKAEKMLNWLSPLFTFAFVSVRTTLVPFWTALINRSLWFGPNHSSAPNGLVISFSSMSILMVLGGFVWSYSLIKGLKKFYKNKAKIVNVENQQTQKKKQ